MILRFLSPIVAAAGMIVLSAAAEEAPAVRVEIRMLAFTSNLQQKEAYAHDPATGAGAAVVTPIKTYLNHQFSTVLLKSRKIIFTTRPDRASLARPEDLIGEVVLPEGEDSAILLFLPGKSGAKGPCQIMPIHDSKRVFPPGSYHVTNLSPLPVRLMLEQKIFDLKPGQVRLIEDPPVREGGQSGMRTFVFKKNVWSPIATGLWPHPGEARGVLVFFQNPGSGDIQLRAFDDVPPRAPSAVPGPKP